MRCGVHQEDTADRGLRGPSAGCQRKETYLVEVLATPLGCMFASMTVEYGEEALASDAGVVDDEGV